MCFQKMRFYTIILSISLNASIVFAQNEKACSGLFLKPETDYSGSELKSTRTFTQSRGLVRTGRLFSASGFDIPWYGKMDQIQSSFEINEIINLKNSEDQILNVGSGDSQLESDLLNTNFQGKITSLDLIEENETHRSLVARSKGKVSFLLGRTLEERFRSGDLKKNTFKYILNGFASDTYSRHLDVSLAVQLSLLRKNGILATIIPTSSYEFNFRGIRVATRIKPTSAISIEKSNIDRRIQDYLKIQGLPFLKHGNFHQIADFPTNHRENIDYSAISDVPPPIEVLVKSAIERMTVHLGGVLGWLENIQGISVIAINQPSEEDGILLIVRKTESETIVPKLTLKEYEYKVGPPRRYYEWNGEDLNLEKEIGTLPGLIP